MTFYCLNLFVKKSLREIKIWFHARIFWNFNINNVRKTLILVRRLIIISRCDRNRIELIWLLTLLLVSMMWISLSQNWLCCSKLLIRSVFFNRRWLSAWWSLLKCLTYALILLIKGALHRLFKWSVLTKVSVYLLLNWKIRLCLVAICSWLNLLYSVIIYYLRYLRNNELLLLLYDKWS